MVPAGTAGLVEVGVGLIPGGAGTLNMLWRSLENIPEGTNANVYENVTQTFKNIALVKIATSAEEAKAYGLIDRVMEHRELSAQRRGAGFAERAS